MFSKFDFMALALLRISAVEAHMMMSQPPPYSESTLNNSPLAADGSDFPCKLRSNAFEPPLMETIVEIGKVMPLNFVGSATHGGGSCQISLTTDLQPSKRSTWMVIKSIEGGCPANVDGNLLDGARISDSYINYTIPDDIKPGKYTLAWTWFNRIGNREMYMNCAPITVTSGSWKSDTTPAKQTIEEHFSNFPAMFIANINGCTTTEGVDISFPDAGRHVEHDGEASNLQPSNQPACTGIASWTVSGGSGSPATALSSSASSAALSATSATFGAAPSSAIQSVEYQSFTPTICSLTSFSDASCTATSTLAEPFFWTRNSGISDSGGLSGFCNPDGVWNCIRGSAFQRCTDGQWSVTQQLAAGTRCIAGQSQDITISANDMRSPIMNLMKSREVPRQ